jgi:hypothetical protein
VYHDVSRRLGTDYEMMPTVIEGLKVYRIAEALAEAGVSRATYFRWVKQGRVADTRYKDRNGRRVFTDEELADLKKAAHYLIDSSGQMPLKF